MGKRGRGGQTFLELQSGRSDDDRARALLRKKYLGQSNGTMAAVLQPCRSAGAYKYRSCISRSTVVSSDIFSLTGGSTVAFFDGWVHPWVHTGLF